jgi:hypothetical protein
LVEWTRSCEIKAVNSRCVRRALTKHQQVRNEQRVYGDSAYASQKALIASKDPNAKDLTNQRTGRAGGVVDEVERGKNRNKSKIRARVEHVFGVVKRLWGLARCDTGDYKRTQRVRSRPWHWPTFTSVA